MSACADVHPITVTRPIASERWRKGQGVFMDSTQPSLISVRLSTPDASSAPVLPCSALPASCARRRDRELHDFTLRQQALLQCPYLLRPIRPDHRAIFEPG